MTISLPKALEERLREQARLLGMDTESYVTGLLQRTVSPTLPTGSLAALFDQMKEQQWTDDPAEKSRRALEEAEFMEAMNRNRTEMEDPGSRRIYP
jgi:hypothetical protein